MNLTQTTVDIFQVGHGTVDSGYELPAGTELLVPVEDPASVFVVGDGDYSWIAV